MLDLLNSSPITIWGIASAALVTGLTGGLHCAGMCGPLSANCAAQAEKGHLFYQVGRLLGYLTLATVGSLLGLGLQKIMNEQLISILPALTIGGVFLAWGLRPWTGTWKFSIPYLKKIQQLSFAKVFQMSGQTRSFLVGLLSIFLPCGLLYGVIIAAIGLGQIYLTLLAVSCFWIGTLPALMGLSELAKRIFRPLSKRSPILTSVVLVTIGLATIGQRVYTTYVFPTHSCH